MINKLRVGIEILFILSAILSVIFWICELKTLKEVYIIIMWVSYITKILLTIKLVKEDK